MKVNRHWRRLHDPWGEYSLWQKGSIIELQYMIGKEADCVNKRSWWRVDKVSGKEQNKDHYLLTSKRIEKVKR